MPYTDYENYAWTEVDTFSLLAIKFHVSRQEILKINNLYPSVPDTLSKVKGLPKVIKIPIVPVTDNAITSYPVSVVWGSVPNSAGITSTTGWRSVGNCVLAPEGMEEVYFPCYPETFNDSRQANYSTQNPIGRSEPFQIYQNSGPRVVSVSFRMHREMYRDVTYIDKIVATVFACTYPLNNGNGHITPRVTLTIGDNCSIVGVIDSTVSADWGETILDLGNPNSGGKYSTVTLSFSVTECTGNPKTASQIAGNLGFTS